MSWYDGFGDTAETVAQTPQVVDVVQGTSGGFSDVFRSVSTGAGDLIKVWQNVKTTENALNQQQFQNELQAAKLNLDKTVALGRISVETAQANRAVQQAQAQAVPNTVVNSRSAGIGMGTLLLIGVAGFFLLRGSKGAA